MKTYQYPFTTFNVYFSDPQSYPGDLVLHNGQVLRHPSPPTVNSSNGDCYGSESSLAVVDSSPPSTHSTSTLPKDEKKQLKQKNSFFKVSCLL